MTFIFLNSLSSLGEGNQKMYQWHSLGSAQTKCQRHHKDDLSFVIHV